MKIAKRIVACLLTAVLLIGLFPMSAFADDEIAVDVIFMREGTQYARKSVKSGSTVTDWPEDPTAPDGMVTEDGDLYDFAGWTDSDGNYFTNESTFDETTTLYATWKTPDMSTVTFQDRYGTQLHSSTLKHNSKLSDYEGYDQFAEEPAFVGWFSENNVQISDTDEITGDMTLHAVFAVTVTFQDVEGNVIAGTQGNSWTALSAFNGYDSYADNDQFVTWQNGKDYYAGDMLVYDNLTLTPLIRKTETDYPVYIGTKGYKTLQDAFNDATDGDTIDLVEDITTNEGTALNPASKIAITLNLNGKTFTNESDSNYAIDITAPVDLTITGNGTIVSDADDCIRVEMGAAGTSLIIDGANLRSEGYYGIYMDDAEEDTRNRLWIKNADIRCSEDSCLYIYDYTDVTIDNGYFYSEEYYALWTNDYCHVLINGGQFQSDTYYAADCDENDDGYIIINSGNFYSKEEYALYTYGNVTINGGKFRSEAKSGYPAFQCNGNDNVVTINGGEFANASDDYAAVYQDGADKMVINGGTFRASQYYAAYAYYPTEIYGGTFEGKMGGLLVGDASTLYGGTFTASDGTSPALVDESKDVPYLVIADGYSADPSDWKNATEVIIKKGSAENQPESETKYYSVTFLDKDGELIATVKNVASGSTVGELDGYDHYAEDSTFMYWQDQDSNVITALTPVEKALTLSPVFAKDTPVEVHSVDDLKAKLADPTVTTIVLGTPDTADSYTVNETISIDRSVTILGNGTTLKRGENCKDAVMQTTGAKTSAEIIGVTVDGQSVKSERAAVLALDGSKLTLTNVTIENCVNTADGDMDYLAALPKPIYGGAISGCGKYVLKSGYGGYKYNSCEQVANVTLNGCTLGNNKAVKGGAISALDMNLTVNGAEICNNKAEKFGGGIIAEHGLSYCDETKATLVNVDIHHNTAQAGGGIYIGSAKSSASYGDIGTEAVRIYGNTAYQGGGLWVGLGRTGVNQDFSGVDFFGNIADTPYGSANVLGDETTTGSCGDDVFDICQKVSVSQVTRTYKNPMASQENRQIEKESHANATIPFVDENGDPEEIPATCQIPFLSWFEDCDYKTPDIRYKNKDESVKIPNGQNDYKLKHKNSDDIDFELYFYGMKAIYFGYLVKYMPNHPDYQNDDVQRYDEKAYAPDATVYVKDNAGFTDYSWPQHVMVGWNTKADGTGDWFGPTFQIHENTILYAIWEPIAPGQLTVSKEVTGLGDKAKSFPFTVTLSDTTLNGTFGDMEFHDGVAEFTLKDGESKTAVSLPAGIRYTVKEGGHTGYTTTVNRIASDTLQGQVIAGAGWEVHYVNDIPLPDSPDPAVVNIEAAKTMDGKTPSGSAFTFVLRDRDGNVVQTVNNNGGSIHFSPMNFREAGVYEYSLSEEKGDNSTIRYDKTVFEVIVTVMIGSDGNAAAAISYQQNGKQIDSIPVFRNTTITDSGDPDAPSQPPRPDKPTKPENPDKPGNPDQPNDPDKPTTPNQPSTPEQPDTPDQPAAPVQPSNPGTPDHTPKTDDTMNLALWISLMGFSLAGLFISLAVVKKNSYHGKRVK